MHKYFEPQDFEKFDAAAESVAQSFLQRLGYTCIENPDVYGIDLLIESKEFGCEVEVKQSLHGADFPFPSLHLPYHKKKFTEGSTFFFVFNNSMTPAPIVCRKVVVASQINLIKNYKIPIGEQIYCIPAERLQFKNF